ncbi:hypothetical protein CP973_20160 [Streptomyces albofaciens JCM 4342]|uniref:hypothetical protein n=1 Tax=Streptomyces albofaciens TaxID=66866 RepID=UPI001238C55E|nr:hypothetical protein [Streptomyces albofaciens]KAA6223925.1 hypothetical protein CP973_20160 [Streptomyces albofaciens JCM 4342]
MDPIVMTAGTAVVSAMATDAWQQTRDAVVAWWRRVHPQQAEAVDSELEEVRARILTVRQAQDAAGEAALVSDWRHRLSLLLRERPELEGELRRLLDQVIIPVLPPREQSWAGSQVLRASASGEGRVYQAGRDQHITER